MGALQLAGLGSLRGAQTDERGQDYSLIPTGPQGLIFSQDRALSTLHGFPLPHMLLHSDWGGRGEGVHTALGLELSPPGY